MSFTKRFCFIILLFLFIGCSSTYVPQSVILPANIKKIAILGFKDTTQHKLMEPKLLYAVKNKFVLDRRIALSSKEEADGLLFGEISRYLVQPLEYDQGLIPKTYMLWIWLDISLVDSKSNTLLWTEKRLEAKINFGNSSNDPFMPSTETEAQDQAAELLSQQVVTRTMDGWFNASGVSEKK
jgi:hypothetical protein